MSNGITKTIPARDGRQTPLRTHQQAIWMARKLRSSSPAI